MRKKKRKALKSAERVTGRTVKVRIYRAAASLKKDEAAYLYNGVVYPMRLLLE